MQFKLKHLAFVGVALALCLGTAQAASVLYPYQGGTGTSTPSGILYGSNSGQTPLQSVTIGSNLTFSGGTLSASGGGSSFSYLFPNNATSTLLNFNGGLTAFASSTIGNGTQAGGLTISGGATTTGNAYFGSSVGSVAPVSSLQIYTATAPSVVNTGANNLRLDYFGGNAAGSLGAGLVFAQKYSSGDPNYIEQVGGIYGVKQAGNGNFGGRLAFYTQGVSGNMTEKMTIDQNGNVGIGTTTPASLLSLAGTSGIFASTTATSTFFGGGINLVTAAGNTGCFAINNVCISGGGGTFPFTVNSWGNSTTTTLGFLNGFLSTAASSTITGGLTVNNTYGTTTINSSVQIATTSTNAIQVNDGYGNGVLTLKTSTSTLLTDFIDLIGSTTNNVVWGVDGYGHVKSGSPDGLVPTVSSCGTSPALSSGSSDNSGTITVGSVSATTCTFTFAHPHATITSCNITSQTGTIAPSYTESLTGFVATNASLTGDILDYNCGGY